MVLLAAYNVLLHKYSGQEDVIVGTPIAGRNHGDVQPLIGIFVNTLAIRSYPASEKTFLSYLNEVKETTLRAFEHQNYPFEQLVDKVQVTRDLSRNPLFDTMFTMQNTENEEFELEGLRLIRYPSVLILRNLISAWMSARRTAAWNTASNMQQLFTKGKRLNGWRNTTSSCS